MLLILTRQLTRLLPGSLLLLYALSAQAVTTSTTLSLSAISVTVGQSVTLTAAISGSSPSGTVTFKDGSTTIGTGTVSSGKASLSTTFKTAGSHSLTAVYGGNTNNTSSTSAAKTHTVSKASTTTTLSLSATSVAVDQSVTLTAKVSGSSPGGAVTFKDGITTIGTGTVSSGKASLNTTFKTVGSHSLTIVYGGDANYNGSTSAAKTLIVNKAATTTTLTVSPNPIAVGKSITLTATINSSSVTGTVTFKDGTTTLGTGIVSSGKASFIASFSTASTHSLTAVYGGDSNYSASTSSAISLKVDATPTVSITAPANNSSRLAPATITLTASAADADGTIAKVEFYNGATLIGTATAAPYTVLWSNVAAGNYTITAKAYDNLGIATTSAAISINLNAPPTVSLTAPANNSSYLAPAAITLSATASDSDGTIAKVEFYNGATLLGTATSAPYAFNWSNVATGKYTLTAKTTDNRGATTTSAAVTVNVNAAPTVNITSPANDAVFSPPGNITITANAADSGGSIAKVEFYNGATLIGTATAAPYAVNWGNVAAGSYTLTAKATDNLGAVTTSSAIAVVVNALPAVSLTAPATMYAAPATVNLTATASDAGGSVTKVELFEGSTLLATLTAAPYTFNWNQVTPGSYTLTAKATDDRGAATTSAPLALSVVTNQAPIVSLNATPATAPEPATIQLIATASDADGSIAKVEFYNGATLLGTVTGAPYTYSWSNVVKGSYSVTAKATDNLGTATASAAVTVTVTGKPVQAYYIYADHLNTPRQVADQNNQVVWQWNQNDPFGNNVPIANNGFEYNLRLPGQYFDKETSLHYNTFRDYDPGTGRYVQSDPIGLDGGINTYSYVNGNPLTYTDPLGLFGWSDMPTIPQPVLDFTTGVSDAASLGLGPLARKAAGVDGGVNRCSKAYSAGEWASLGLGAGRMAYAGIAKIGAAAVADGASAMIFRNGLKRVMRGPFAGSDFRIKNYADLMDKYGSDAAIQAAAGRTNAAVNAVGADLAIGGSVGAASCECQ